MSAREQILVDLANRQTELWTEFLSTSLARRYLFLPLVKYSWPTSGKCTIFGNKNQWIIIKFKNILTPHGVCFGKWSVRIKLCQLLKIFSNIWKIRLSNPPFGNYQHCPQGGANKSKKQKGNLWINVDERLKPKNVIHQSIFSRYFVETSLGTVQEWINLIDTKKEDCYFTEEKKYEVGLIERLKYLNRGQRVLLIFFFVPRVPFNSRVWDNTNPHERARKREKAWVNTEDC